MISGARVSKGGEGMTTSGRRHGSPCPLNKHPPRNRPHLGLIGEERNVDLRQRLDDFGCSGFYQLVKQGIWTCCKNEKRQWGFHLPVCLSVHPRACSVNSHDITTPLFTQILKRHLVIPSSRPQTCSTSSSRDGKVPAGPSTPQTAADFHTQARHRKTRCCFQGEESRQQKPLRKGEEESTHI